MIKSGERKNKGFSMAELMAVVGIIAVLAGVIFIALGYYFRLLKQLEYDAIAKEIFISAQNHLSLVENENYLGIDDDAFGTPESSDDIDESVYIVGAYYYIVGEDKTVLRENNSLSLMMPFASIDDTVRLSGSYIIRYHKDTGRVLDVFYSSPKSYYGYTFNSSDSDSENEAEYNTLLTNYRGTDKVSKKARREYGSGKKVIGYYGGEQVNSLETVDDLYEPELEIVNAERLKASVKNIKDILQQDSNAKIRLIVTGLTSGNSRYIDVEIKTVGEDVVAEAVLDSITEQNSHFYDMFCNGENTTTHTNIKGKDNLIPGENITVQAKVFRSDALGKIAFSDKKQTNSIFATSSTDSKALISNIRHLENLSVEVSKLDNNRKTKTINAEQVSDLDYRDFKQIVGSYNGVYVCGNNTVATSEFLPVSIAIADSLSYNGGNHKISYIVVNKTGDTGLFGSVTGCNISNLELINFSISGGNNAGALAGSISSTGIDNVIAIEQGNFSSDIKGTSNSGGLVGLMTNGRMNYCAAAVHVSSTANNSNAGGLIGSVSATETGTVDIKNSYSAGHTSNGKYMENKIDVESTSGNAGGLIGYANKVKIDSCYSTCSTDGGISAGGLIGSLSNSEMKNTYAVGYVKLDKNADGEFITNNKGALVGADSSNSYTGDNRYLAIANNSSLKGVSDKTISNVYAADEKTALYTSTENYSRLLSEYLKGSGSGVDAKPYDNYLITRYQNKYQYLGIKELSSVSDEKFVSKHYGDWPSYETFIINE
ncbi:MAG: type II secretion system protein [Erysipelotrichaceae bacterium]|nr:type II secretion system protein [Erysipelotrichaceae bacterium]